MRDRLPTTEGDIDRLLTDFYRAQMPNPWPTIATPDSEAREIRPLLKIASPQRAGMPGRWALAASILILAVTSVWLAGLAPTPRTGPGVDLNNGIAEPLYKPTRPDGAAPAVGTVKEERR